MMEYLLKVQKTPYKDVNYDDVWKWISIERCDDKYVDVHEIYYYAFKE